MSIINPDPMNKDSNLPPPSQEGGGRRFWRFLGSMEQMYKQSYGIALVCVVLGLILQWDVWFSRNFTWHQAILETLIVILPNLIAVLLIYFGSLFLLEERQKKEAERAKQILHNALDENNNIQTALEAVKHLSVEGFSTSGITTICEGLESAGAKALINAALQKGENVQILVTMMADNLITVDSFRYARDSFKDKTPRDEKSTPITIIFVNPNSLAAAQRSIELAYTKNGEVDGEIDVNHVQNRIETKIQDLYICERDARRDAKTTSSSSPLLTIGYVESVPGLYLCICGSEALVGFFCYSQIATVGPILKVTGIPSEVDGTAKTLPQLVRCEFDKAFHVAKNNKEAKMIHIPSPSTETA